MAHACLTTPLPHPSHQYDPRAHTAGGELTPKGQHFITTIKNSSNHLLNSECWEVHPMWQPLLVVTMPAHAT